MTSTYSATYDAWNRLVEIKDGDNVVLTCEYDGLGRRTKTFVNTSDPLDQTYDAYLHFYYNSGWQILETRRSDSENDPPESESPEVQYVWSRRYIDAPVLRDRDADADSETGNLGVTDSGLEERLYYTTDANMNVTALLDTGGDAVERYVYGPYGNCTVYDDDWSDEVSWANSKQNHIRYCGYYFDNETGLCHVRHRVYDPPLGRWLQRDPIGYVAGLQMYSYVGHSPTLGQDPLGLIAWPIDPTYAAREAHERFCRWLEGQILSYVETSKGRRAVRNFFAAGHDIQLTNAEIMSIKDASPKLEKRLDELVNDCEKGGSWEWKTEEVRDDVLSPWHEAIGHNDAQLITRCQNCCLSWRVYIQDYFDFLPRAIEERVNPEKSQDRGEETERSVTAVWLAQQCFQCGWREFYHNGISNERQSGKECPRPE